MATTGLLARVKQNLIIEHSFDDVFLQSLIDAAVSYAEQYQHREDGYYTVHDMSETTKQGVTMLASNWYESRDGGTGGFFSNTPSSQEQAMNTVHLLLRLGRDWKV